MKEYQTFKGNNGNLNYKCVVYKKVKISNKEYTAVITDICIEIEPDECWNHRCYTSNAYYECNMFDENDNIIFNKTIKRGEDKKYFNVINEFCIECIREKLLYDKNFYEEQRQLKALQTLEQWDGIFSIDDVLNIKI